MKTPEPLKPGDIMELALSGKPIPASRTLATFADPENWIQLYDSKTSSSHYVPKACEWAFIGLMRPPYELAQHGLNSIQSDAREDMVPAAELQAVEKAHTALRLASEELIACVRHGDQEDIGEAMAKVEAILQPKEQ